MIITRRTIPKQLKLRKEWTIWTTLVSISGYLNCSKCQLAAFLLESKRSASGIRTRIPWLKAKISYPLDQCGFHFQPSPNT